ncbi:hypothetical protein SAY87_020981 [Trapa incisa]|uniref:DUF4378 domain-containing protein n=1 Tax=Trapa incisa TaxID=236973 RepID=A0AAN7JWI6_9MYRT|nr:hypothetical protein SAY87_020981 [Trapa incisa]
MKIINAVKLLTFPSVAKSISSPETGGKSRRCLFPRNLSRRLLKKRFLRKAEAEQPHIGQWKLYRNILAEKDTQAQLDRSSSSIRNATFTGRLASATSWDYSEFSDIITYGGNNSSATEGGALVVSVEKDLLSLPKPDEGTPDQEEEVSERVGADVGGIQEVESPGTAPREACSVDWPNEEKEQFSPLSVLDCPFEDDDDDDDPGSASMCSPTHGGGSRKRNGLMRGRRVKSLSRLEPLSLDKRLSSSELENGPLEPTGLESLSTPSTGNCFGVISEVKTRSEELLRAVMINNPDIGPAEENLLYDFFIQKLESGCADELEALKAAEGWLTKGTPRGIRDGWEVQSGRVAYVRDMEENCKGWRTSGEEHMEVALEVDDEVWRGLIVEILHDL